MAIFLARFSALLISSCLSSAARAFSAAATFVLYSSKIKASSAEYVGAFWLREVPEIEKQGQFRHVCGPTSKPSGRLSRRQEAFAVSGGFRGVRRLSRCQEAFAVSSFVLCFRSGRCTWAVRRESAPRNRLEKHKNKKQSLSPRSRDKNKKQSLSPRSREKQSLSPRSREEQKTKSVTAKPRKSVTAKPRKSVTAKPRKSVTAKPRRTKNKVRHREAAKSVTAKPRKVCHREAATQAVSATPRR